MKPRIRMLALDLDGTLLNSQRVIAEEDRQALREAFDQGVEIVPVTGRNYYFALPIVAGLPFDGPLISSNGAVIRSKKGETFSQRLLPAGTASAVLAATREFRPYTVLSYDRPGPGQLRVEHDEDDGAALTAHPRGILSSQWLARNRSLAWFVESLEEAVEADPLQVMFAGPVATMRRVETILGNGGFGGGPLRPSPAPQSPLQRSNDPAQTAPFRLLRTIYPEHDMTILDVIHADCSKGSALRRWSRARGIPAAEIMAIGDNFNDLEMLRFAGVPVVMGNADEALKRQGWAVTRDCDSGGVAHAVRQFVL